MKRQSNSGFTIIELLIATAVFSVVLLVLSAAIIQIGRLYYKGITSARTQEVARSLISDIAQNIQFNVGQVEEMYPPDYLNGNEVGSSRSICIATKQYSFKFGQQQVNGRHGLVVRDVPSGCLGLEAQDVDTATVEGNELLGDKMRLSNLVVQLQDGSTNTYSLTVRVVYGDNDLLCSPSLNNCQSTEDMSPEQIANARDLSCKNIRSGTQFCAASELSTIVKRRLVK